MLLIKNLLQFSLCIISLWLLGFGFAEGNRKSTFIGEDLFGGEDWLEGKDCGLRFNSLCIICCFIIFLINGSIAEKSQYGTYVLVALVIPLFIWPTVVAWISSPDGWLIGETHKSIIELGSIYIYTFAGTFSLVGSILTGRRPISGSQSPSTPIYSLYVLGSFLTILGLLGIPLYFINSFDGIVFANLWICGSVSSVTSLKLLTFLSTDLFKHYQSIYQGFMAGMVFITSSSNNVTPWESALYGLMSGFVFSLGIWLFNRLKIDDVLMITPTFLLPGIFGGVLPGFVDHKFGVYWGGWESGQTLGSNVVGTTVVFLWGCFWATAVFGPLKIFDCLNLPPALVESGLEGSSELKQSGFQVKTLVRE